MDLSTIAASIGVTQGVALSILGLFITLGISVWAAEYVGRLFGSVQDESRSAYYDEPDSEPSMGTIDSSDDEPDPDDPDDERNYPQFSDDIAPYKLMCADCGWMPDFDWADAPDIVCFQCGSESMEEQ